MPTQDSASHSQPLRTDDLDYDLPEHLIACRPAEPRDAARMLVVHADRIEHRHISNLPEYLTTGDGLVMNNTRVMPARIVGHRTDSGGHVEGLILQIQPDGRWQAMLRSNGRLRSGLKITLLDPSDQPSDGEIELESRQSDGTWLIKPGDDDLLSRCGRTPLPPYILRARKGATNGEPADDADRDWYQTVFAQAEGQSVAAPTAGLHFTPNLLDRLDSAGIRRVEITLEVGPGTFKPVTADTLDKHPMHAERFSATAEAIAALREIRDSGGRVFAVGTTTMRTLESLPPDQPAQDVHRSTQLMIAPGHRFNWVDGLLTNFHLPRSTLLALVAARIGLDRTRSIYAEAVAEEYRFYSYGDAMLILPDCET